MRRTLAGLLALLILLPALWAEDDKEAPKRKSAAADDYQALVKEYEQAQEEFNKALQELAWETVSKYPYSGVKAEKKEEK